jgi:hypothetical protein
MNNNVQASAGLFILAGLCAIQKESINKYDLIFILIPKRRVDEHIIIAKRKVRSYRNVDKIQLKVIKGKEKHYGIYFCVVITVMANKNASIGRSRDGWIIVRDCRGR